MNYHYKKAYILIVISVAFLMPSLSFAAFDPVQAITIPNGVAGPTLKFKIDTTKIPEKCVNPNLTATITANNTGLNAISFSDVSFYNAKGRVGLNKASKDALTNTSYAFTFTNFGIPESEIRKLEGLQVAVSDYGGPGGTGDRVQITDVRVSVDCSVGASCVSTDLSLAAAKPPATLASIQGARPIIGYGGGCSGGSSASSGPNGGTVFGVTGASWGNPDNAAVNGDGNYAIQQTDEGHFLTARGFNFSIPAGSTVNGITFTVYLTANLANAVNDGSIRIVKNSTVVGTEKARSASFFWPDNTPTAVNFGGTADVWGVSWTPTDINNANFGFNVNAIGTGGFVSASVDYVSATISYTTAATCASVYDSFIDVLRKMYYHIIMY